MIQSLLEKPAFRAFLKKVFPWSLLLWGWGCLATFKARRAKAAFKKSLPEPIWLPAGMLDELRQQYPIHFSVKYDPASRQDRGGERVGHLLNQIHDKNVNTFLELGAWDGMVGWALQKRGKTATALDIRADGFDGRARDAGVRFVQADAASTGLKDGEYDCVFSYASFEHFAAPTAVLKEAMRLLRLGGYIYLNFGPLFMSPWGLHIESVIGIPYLQLLFKPEDIQQYAQTNRLGNIGFDEVNGWSLEQYRDLWKKYSDKLQIKKYHEISVISYLDLVVQYPSCFKSKTSNFENLVVESIEVLFKKVG